MTSMITEDEQLLAAGYVLGDLSESEIISFESALVNNPSLQAEVNALQEAFGIIPQGLDQITPPPSLKAKIMAAAAESFNSAMVNDSVINQPIVNNEVVNSPIILPKKPTISVGKIITGISLLVGGLLVFDNFRLRQELQFAQQVNQQELAKILEQPKSRLVSLNTKDNQAIGNILFTPGQWQNVIVSARNLPPLEADQVYRMWLELQNGQIIPCGEFTTNKSQGIFVKLNAKENPPQGVKAKGVFITIDKANAPLQPTGDRLIQGTI